MNLPLTELIAQLAEAKHLEKQANQQRLSIETLILTHPDVTTVLKPEGTTTFKALDLSIATGYTRTWDASHLIDLSAKIKPEFFPFKTEFKEDRKASKVVEERFPDLWTELAGALTLKPKKPTLTLKGELA